MKIHGWTPVLAAGLVSVTVAGCHNYVKRDEFDATVASLRNDNAAARQESRDEIASLGRDLQGKLDNQQVAITDLKDSLRLDMTAHFDFGKAALRSDDKQALNDFASVVRKRPGMQVTVEGFADPAGSPAYNKQLGLRRAEAVRTALLEQGLPAGSLKAVSYGAERDRQLAPGAWGVQGQANRRVALVVEKSTADRVGMNEKPLRSDASGAGG